MRKHTNILASVILLFWCLFVPAPVIADNYQIYMGEGKPEASLTLSNVKYFSLSMAQCTKSQNETTVNVGLIVDEKATVSPEVARLRNVQPDTKRNIDLCINERCKNYTWEYSDFDSFLWTSISLGQKRERINSVRVVIPNDNTNYEFRGDVEKILKRICKR